jgi:hypothetical protein
VGPSTRFTKLAARLHGAFTAEIDPDGASQSSTVEEEAMSLTTLIFLGLIGWMLFMHTRRGGHGGCCGGHGGEDHTTQGGGEDGTA